MSFNGTETGQGENEREAVVGSNWPTGRVPSYHRCYDDVAAEDSTAQAAHCKLTPVLQMLIHTRRNSA